MNLRKIHLKRCLVSVGLTAFFLTGMTSHASSVETHGTGYRSISEYLPEEMTKQPIRKQSREADSLPAVFDPRKSETYLTRVKNQGGTGCCWVFSSLDSAEMSAIKNGEKPSDFALSVWQTVYFHYNRVTDPMGLTEGDKNFLSGTDILDKGGNTLILTMTLAQGISPADEDVAPLKDMMAAWEKDKYQVSLPDSKAYQGYRLKESTSVMQSDIPGIKKALLKYGAGTISYYADHEQEKWWNASTNGMYVGDSGLIGNHSVTVVGWDDHFPKEDFGTQLPPQDGAWLVKNTWGTEWADQGYFWLSYYDKSLTESNTTAQFFSITDITEDEHLYQYDGTSNIETIYSNGTAVQANVFQAQGYESITDVSFFTLQPDVNYKVEIYKGYGLRNANPTGSGTPLFTATGKSETVGYHTISLDTPLKLDKGEEFSVVLHTGAQNSGIVIPVDSSSDYGWCSSTASSKPGQSFLLQNGTWTDIGAKGDMNLRIKACTRDRDGELILSTRPDADEEENNKKTLTSGDTLQLYARTVPDSQTVSWSSDHPDVASISENGLITAQNPGTATISASFQYKGRDITSQFYITVTEPDPPVQPDDPDKPGQDPPSPVQPDDPDKPGQDHLQPVGPEEPDVPATDHKDPDNKENVITDTTQKVTSIRLSLDSPKVAPGKSIAFDITVLPENASCKSLIFTSSNSGYASVDNRGILHTTKAGAGKTVRITAQTTDGSNLKTVYTIKIQKKAVKKISFKKKISSVKAGKKVSLKVSVLPAKGANTSVRYISSRPEYATVNSRGQLKALPAGKGKKVKITALSRDGSGKKASMVIRIR